MTKQLRSILAMEIAEDTGLPLADVLDMSDRELNDLAFATDDEDETALSEITGPPPESWAETDLGHDLDATLEARSYIADRDAMYRAVADRYYGGERFV